MIKMQNYLAGEFAYFIQKLTSYADSIRVAARLTSAACLLGLAACSSPGDPAASNSAPTCVAYTSTADLTKPVSFASDVVPILQKSCAAAGGTCHGPGANATPMSLALGSGDAGVVTPQAIVARLVGVTAAEEPMMPLVTAGDPGRSYLMHKMDGDQCTLSAACNTGDYKSTYPNCGGVMPQPIPPQTTSTSLGVADRDTVRAWIKQGAHDD